MRCLAERYDRGTCFFSSLTCKTLTDRSDTTSTADVITVNVPLPDEDLDLTALFSSATDNVLILREIENADERCISYHRAGSNQDRRSRPYTVRRACG